MIRVKICTPYRDESEFVPEHTKSILALAHLEGFEFTVQREKSMYLNRVRNKLQGGDFDYFLWVDSDVSFSPDDFLRLYNHHLPFVSGAVPYKDNPQALKAYYWEPGYPGFWRHPEGIVKAGSGLIECDAVGYGFVLQTRECRDAIPYPWFSQEIVDAPPEFEYDVDCVGEDLSYCLKLARAGVKIYLDLNCVCGHHERKKMENQQQIDPIAEYLKKQKDHEEWVYGLMKMMTAELLKERKKSEELKKELELLKTPKPA